MTACHDVAIIGMACLFPGAQHLDAYWRNILGKVDAVGDPPPDAWDPAFDGDPGATDPDQIYCRRGGYIGPLASFEPLAHGIPPRAVGGEPDQWLALQLAHDALADAGCLQLDEAIRRRTAVILGKGTYLNGGNGLMIQHAITIGQTLELLKRLIPGLTDEQLRRLRREMKKSLPPIGPEIMPGLIPNIIVGRIANRLDLSGPTYTVDAACASSLLAVQVGLRHLATGECDLALVGGANVWVPAPTLSVFCQLGALSRRQQIRPFDEQADGTLLGEGIGMVVLKRLTDAKRDGNRIYAVIKGVGVSSDGRGVSVMAPRVEGEELALRRAFESTGVTPSTVGLIEAHGTGTPVGDVVEVQALCRVFGQRANGFARTALGSVKSMIAHTMPAAGVAGLIKVALALHHKVLPPTLHCSTPNPRLELERTPFYINTETRPWIHGAPEPRRAGVNAFGFGGINAHVILEEYRDSQEAGGGAAFLPDHAPPWDSEVCILEGASPGDLLQRAEQLASFLQSLAAASGPGDGHQDDRPSLADLACSLNCRLDHSGAPYRLAVVCTSLDDLGQKLQRAVRRLADPHCRQIKDVSGIYFTTEPLARQGKLAFLFPGEGSQYSNMLADLCLHIPEARRCFDQSDRAYAGHPRGYLLSDFLFPCPLASAEERAAAESRLLQMDGAIEAVHTANQALLAVMEGLKVRPDVILGHSTGDFSALRAAFLDIQSEEQLVDFIQGLYQNYQESAARDGVPKAALLAIGAGRDRAEAIVREAGGDVYLAMDNCPHQAVLIGALEAVDRALAIAQREGLIYQRLAFDRAYHTPLFAPFSDGLRRLFAAAPLRQPRLTVYSCATAAPYPSEPRATRELAVQQWERPVEFQRTIEALYAEGVRLFVEVGPRGNLTAFVEDILRGRSFCAVPANLQRRSGIAQINHLVGILAVHGVSLDPSFLYRRRDCKPVSWVSDPGTAAPAQPSMRLKLDTNFPMLRAPAAIADGGQSPNFAAAAPYQERSAPPETHIAPSAPAEIVPAHAPYPGVDLGEMAATDGCDWGTAPPALQGYLETMERFLEVQEQVMGAYLSGSDTPASAWGAQAPDRDTGIVLSSDAPDGGGHHNGAWEGNVPDFTPSAAPAPSPAGPAASPRPGPCAALPYPLLGEVIRHTPGEELIAWRVFEPAEDLYLRDHTLGRDVSLFDPDLRALALMPLTMSLEILAEAALALVPGRKVVGLRDVRAHRWLAFDDQPQTLQVTARCAQRAAEVAVQLRNLTEDGEEGEASRNPVVEATVVLGEDYPEAPPPLQPSATWPASRWDPDRLYADAMFHGPCWQGVAAIEQTGPDGVAARLRALAWSGFLRGVTAPRFVLDPVTLDAAGQVIGFWTTEHLATGKVIFPFRVEALQCFGPPPQPGATLTCVAAIRLVGGQQVRSDIDVATADGQLWTRLVGWWDKRFNLPPSSTALLLASRRLGLSEEWRAPLARCSSSPHLQCRRSLAEFSSDRSFWKRVLAFRILSRAERERFRALRKPEDKQLEWLFARAAAKESVQQLLLERYGLELAPADVEILPDERGCPRVSGPWRERVPASLAVSLAHSKGWSVALAGLAKDQAGLLLGIDVERLGPRADAFTETAFDDRERQLLAGLGPDLQEEWALRAWCAKEAVGKALGYGLIDGPASVALATVSAALGVVGVRLARRLAAVCPGLAGATLVVYTSRQDDLVAAVTLCERTRTEKATPAPGSGGL